MTPEDVSSPSPIDMLRRSLQKRLRDTGFVYMLDMVQAVLSLIACVLYVVTLEYEAALPRVPLWVTVLDWIITVIFTLDYLIRMFAAEDRLEFVLRWHSIVDLLSILPAITLVVRSVQFGFLRILRALRTVRILRSYRALADNRGDDDGGPAAVENTILRQSIYLGVSILSIIFIATGIVVTVETSVPGSFSDAARDAQACDMDSFREENIPSYLWPPECRFSFLTGLYAVFITVSTVGFGDISPTRDLSRGLIVAILLVLLVIGKFKPSLAFALPWVL